MRTAVWQEHDISLPDVVLIPPASLPKTTSGKVQRRVTKALFLSGELLLLRSRAPEKQPDTPVDTKVAEYRRLNAEDLQQRILSEALALTATGTRPEVTDTFGAIGIDSVIAAQLAARLSELLGLTLEPTLFWQYQTPQLLARHLAPESRSDSDGQPPATRSKQDLLRALKAALGEPTLEKQE